MVLCGCLCFVCVLVFILKKRKGSSEVCRVASEDECG